jgi:hypothetical protein
VDIQKHFQILLGTQLLFQLLPDYFHFESAVPVAVWVIVRKEMPVHVFSLQIRTVIPAHYAVGVHDRDNPDFVQLPEFVADNFF